MAPNQYIDHEGKPKICGIELTQVHCNRILGVFYTAYAVGLLAVPEAFMKAYWNEDYFGDGLTFLFFTRGIALEFAAIALACYYIPSSYGISLANLVGSTLNFFHAITVCWGLYGGDTVWKQMWLGQLAISAFFIYIAYTGFREAKAIPHADATQQFSTENCNKFLGYYFTLLSFVLTAMPFNYWSHFFIAKAISAPLQAFYFRLYGIQLIPLAIAGLKASNDQGTSLMMATIIFGIGMSFAYLFMGRYDFLNNGRSLLKVEAWEDSQLAINVVLLIVATVGYRHGYKSDLTPTTDSPDTDGVTAIATIANPDTTTAVAGSML